MRRIATFIILLIIMSSNVIYADSSINVTNGAESIWSSLSDAHITLIVLSVMGILFATNIIPLSITAIGGAISLGLLGIIPAKEIFSGLSDSNVVLFAGMFIVGGAVFKTGLAELVGEKTVKIFGKSESGFIFGMMILAALMSSVSSNTATTAALMPMVGAVALSANIKSSKLYMALAYAAGLGGTITLVGTPPNSIANTVLKSSELNYAPFGFLEFAKIGIPLTIAGIAYMMLIGKKLLPDIPNKPISENNENKAEKNKKKMIITGITLIVAVILMSQDFKRFPFQAVAVAAAIVLVLTKCIDEKTAYKSVEWSTIFIFAGVMPVAKAMQTTGAGEMLANKVLSVLGTSPSPYFICVVLFLLSSGLTQFMSNTASASLLAPIGLSLATSIGADPHSVIMIIVIGASCAFATPIGTPPNTMVLIAGQYKFMDYVKVGIPLILVCMVVSVIVIPFFWPFFV